MAISLTLFYGSPNAHNGAAASLGSIARASQKLNAIALSQFRVSLTAVLFLTSLAPCGADPAPERATAHDSGPMWIATPSSQGTCTLYSLPVSRRFAYVFRIASDSCRKRAVPRRRASAEPPQAPTPRGASCFRPDVDLPARFWDTRRNETLLQVGPNRRVPVLP